MRSRFGLWALLWVAVPATALAAPLIAYDDQLRNGFADWSWATHDLGQSVVVYAPTAGSSCPSNTITGTEPMGNSILAMLENSDNQRTKAMINTYGMAAINNTAASIGLTGTHLNHYPGCGGPPANQLTLADAGTIYEGIANGMRRSDLHERMF